MPVCFGAAGGSVGAGCALPDSSRAVVGNPSRTSRPARLDIRRAHRLVLALDHRLEVWRRVARKRSEQTRRTTKSTVPWYQSCCRLITPLLSVGNASTILVYPFMRSVEIAPELTDQSVHGTVGRVRL